MLTAEERYQQYRWTVLSQASFESELGIWEPYWWANNVLSDLPVEKRIGWAERAMVELLEGGLIRFFHRGWLDPPDVLSPVADESAMAMIRGDDWRRLPLDKAEIWFEATEKGDRRIRDAVQNREWLGEEAVALGWAGRRQGEDSNP